MAVKNYNIVRYLIFQKILDFLEKLFPVLNQNSQRNVTDP